MTAHNEHIDALIAGYFEGQLAPAEENELREWRDADPENELFFRDMEFVFYASASIREPQHFDVDKAWSKVELGGAPQRRTFRIPGWQGWSAAAAILLITLVTYIFLSRDSFKRVEYAAVHQMLEVTLPDSSHVLLEPGAKLTAFSDDPKSREYRFEGKASFSVEHNEDHPFTLYVGVLSIKDLGTRFTVDAPQGSDTVWLEVQEGKVSMSSNAGKKEAEIELVAGEKAFYLKRYDHFSRVVPEKVKRVSGTFDFRGQNLGEVATILSAHFSTEIVLVNSSIMYCPIDVNFRDESLSQIIDIIAATLGLEVEEKGNHILLKGHGCN